MTEDRLKLLEETASKANSLLAQINHWTSVGALIHNCEDKVCVELKRPGWTSNAKFEVSGQDREKLMDWVNEKRLNLMNEFDQLASHESL